MNGLRRMCSYIRSTVQLLKYLIRSLYHDDDYTAQPLKLGGVLQGAVVNISSIAAIMPGLVNATYGVAKAAQDALTKNLAFEYAPKGVRVNSILPGQPPAWQPVITSA